VGLTLPFPGGAHEVRVTSHGTTGYRGTRGDGHASREDEERERTHPEVSYRTQSQSAPTDRHTRRVQRGGYCPKSVHRRVEVKLPQQLEALPAQHGPRRATKSSVSCKRLRCAGRLVPNGTEAQRERTIQDTRESGPSLWTATIRSESQEAARDAVSGGGTLQRAKRK